VMGVPGHIEGLMAGDQITFTVEYSNQEAGCDSPTPTRPGPRRTRQRIVEVVDAARSGAQVR